MLLIIELKKLKNIFTKLMIFQMLFTLELKTLENILKDGVKEMLSQVAGKTRDAKRRPWFKAVKAAVNEYQRKVREDFLPVLVSDFGGDIAISFTGGMICEEDIDKIKLFMEMVEKSNPEKLKNELLKTVEDFKEIESPVNEEQQALNEKLDRIKDFLADGHSWILERIDLFVRSVIKETLHRNTIDRSQIEVMLYNFVDGEVPETVRKLFENGMNSVPSLKLTKQEVDKRVENALLEYVTRLGRRRIYGYNRVMHASDTKEWLRQVKIMSMDEDSKNFVEKLELYYPALKAELELVYTDVNIDTKEELIRKLEREGCVLVNCDKNMGMSLFKLETMRKADEELMNQLGAIRMESPFGNTKEVIIQCVKREIKKFEVGLDIQQREFMNSKFEDRYSGRAKITFPFLKSVHKVQKMTDEEIQNKDLSRLKFRPVVDAKQWLTKGYSAVIMHMMRELINELLELSGPVLRNIKTKNGWRFAVEIQDYIVEDEFDIMASADIKEAYTNITDELIKKAVQVVGEFVGYEDWKLELMKKLVDLVLGQNYAETSGGFFKFKEVLPMGYKLSGEALDIVALADEMTVLYHLGGNEGHQRDRVRVGELKSFPEEFVENGVQSEVKMSNGVRVFKRYVDDTHTQIAGTREEVLHGILAVGYIYPQSLVISMNLNIWHSSFLDVLAWKSLLTGTVSTVMKRGSGVPVGHVRRGSSHPEKYKLQSLLGEMLRARRISSDPDLIEHSDECISIEFESIGYSRREVEDAMVQARGKVENKYSPTFVKIPDDDDVDGRRFFSYGGGLVHNKNYRYGEVLVNFINNVKPKEDPGLVLLPDLKIKNLAYTRKRYLKRQDEDNKKQRS